MKYAIAALRQRLPASIAVCRQALEAAGGDLSQAHALVVDQLVADYGHRTGLGAAEAAIELQAAGHDVERAMMLWRRRHPSPPPRPFAALEKGWALAAEVASVDTGLRCFAHVTPGEQDTYELRMITHAARFTETAYGFDYDYAMQDAQTRVERRFVTEFRRSTFCCRSTQLMKRCCAASMPSTAASCTVPSRLTCKPICSAAQQKKSHAKRWRGLAACVGG